jgi:hypothetical protein
LGSFPAASFAREKSKIDKWTSRKPIARRIAAEEAANARRLLAADIDQKAKNSPTSRTCSSSATRSSPKPRRPRPT